MATVYKAHDLKHDRPVALKVLKPELAAVIGAERFLKEIRVTANLQHPHILPLHDSGEADSFLYYVMPYVEGESLRDKLDREKQLAIDDAIEIARGVAAALDYAHRQDVIHRDIKPENILMHDGQATVADFGIALAISEAGANRLTETGLSIGTPQYMSPEQAMGDRELDSRSDIYSLAAMMYEMLTGDPPYMGSTAQAIVAKVITEKAPPVTSVRDTVPGHVAAAIQKALAKLPADRFRTAAEFADAIAAPGAFAQSVSGEVLEATERVATRPARTFSTMQLGGVVAVAGVAIVAALWGWLRPGPEPILSRFAVAIPEAEALAANHDGSALAFSPDGLHLVYTGPGRQLMVRDIGQLEARPLPGTEGARMPFFSPDGEWVGFMAEGKLRKVALRGGPPLTITENVNTIRGASWGPNDMIVFTPSTSGGLYRVAGAGGPATEFTTPNTQVGETSYRWPDILPDGSGVVFTIYSGSMDDAQLAAYSFETGEVTDLVLKGLHPQYTSTGHLVYGTTDGSLVAVPFDTRKLEVTGGPVSILEGVMTKSSIMAEFTLSRTGSLAYLSGEASDLELALVDTLGESQTLLTGIRAAQGPRFSPDGSKIALRTSEAGNPDIRIYDIKQQIVTRMTFEGTNDYPAWTPDGRSLLFTSVRDGGDRDLYRRFADGSGSAVRILERANVQWEITVAPDGRTVVFREISPETGHDLWMMELGSDSAPRPYLVTQFNERSPAISPDGRWLAYTSNEAGKDEVYVRAFPQASGRWQISSDGGNEPAWGPDGRRIFYKDGENVIEVMVQTTPTFAPRQRRVFLELERLAANSNHTNYDVSPSGKEFAFLRLTALTSSSLIVVQNWFEELKDRMETAGRAGR